MQRIHPQLLAGCHYLGALSVCDVLLNRNASLPWFILVPDTQLNDLLEERGRMVWLNAPVRSRFGPPFRECNDSLDFCYS
jgi:hypothetical protein